MYVPFLYERSARLGEGVKMSERRYKNPQVNLRLPEELKDKVAKLADKHKRSANAEMVAAIEHWVSEYEQLESNQATIDLVNSSPDIRSNYPISAILNEFVEKVAPLLKQEIDRREKLEEEQDKVNKKPT